MESSRKYVMLGIVLTIALLIIIVGWTLYGHFSYGKEWADYGEVYRTEKGAFVFMDDDPTSHHAIYRYDQVYLPVEMVMAELNDRFYLSNENALLYTLPYETIEVVPGQRMWTIGGMVTKTDWPVCYEEEGILYVAIEYVTRLTDLQYSFFEDPQRLMLVRGSKEEYWALVEKEAQVRVSGDRKAPILAEVTPKDEVCILEDGEDWTKVRTADGFIGYLPSKVLGTPAVRMVESGYEMPDYTGAGADIEGPVRLVWHQVFVPEANQTLTEYLEGAEGINVISPTWYALADNEGSLASLAEQWYVDEAHARGLQVWGLVNDFDTAVDKYQLLSRTSSRRTLIANLIAEARYVGLDGINIDFEQINKETGVHYIQFLRELSVECRKEGLVLSVDNYSLVGGRTWYYIREQGVMVDFVIMMGYDEHWSGGEAGSTASITFTEDTIQLALNQVPAEKLIHGIPFYTRVWGEERGVQVSSTAAGMEAAKELLEENDAQLQWLDEEGQYFGEYISEGIKYSIWLEDVTSLKLKLDMIEKYNLAGVACWKLNLEDDAVWPLISGCLD